MLMITRNEKLFGKLYVDNVQIKLKTDFHGKCERTFLDYQSF